MDGIEIISNEPPVVWIGDVSIIGMDYIEENYYFCEDDDEIGCDNIDETKIEAIFSQEEYGYVYLSSNHYDESSYLEEYEWYSDLDGFIGDTSSLMFYSDEDVFLSEGLHNISVRGMDSFGLWSNWSESLELEIIYNDRPRIQQIYVTDQEGNNIHDSHKHFCCGEIYFEVDVEDDGEIVEYKWWFNDELLSTESTFSTSYFNVGSNNYVYLDVKDDLGFWSGNSLGFEEEWFFVYPGSPFLETSIIKDNEYGDGQNVTLEIAVIPSIDGGWAYEQNYMIETSLGEGFYLSLYGDTVNLSLYTWLQYGVHEIYLEICHYREWYEDDETYHLCSDTVIEVRINTPPIALIEDIGNSDSPASVLFMEKVFFEGRGIDEDGEIV